MIIKFERYLHFSNCNEKKIALEVRSMFVESRLAAHRRQTIVQYSERAVIQHLRIKGLAPKAIQADMVATLGKDAPSYATVKR